MVSPPLPKEATDIKIIEREWGIELSFKTPNGTKIYTPALFTTSIETRKSENEHSHT